MPKAIQLDQFHWGIPNGTDKRDYIAELNRMWKKVGRDVKNQGVHHVCLALQIFVTLDQTNVANRSLHGTAMMVIYKNATHLDAALATIHDELLQDNKNEYLMLLKKIGKKYYKDTDFLPQAIERLEAKNLYKEAKEIIQKSRELLISDLPSKNTEFNSLEERIVAMGECEEEVALDNINVYHKNAKILLDHVTTAIQQAKAKREAIATLLPFACVLDDACMEFRVTVGNRSFPIYYNSIERLDNENEDVNFIVHEILRYLCEKLMKEYQHYIAENNLSSTHMLSKANKGLASIVKASDNSPGRIQYVARYINGLLATENTVIPYDTALREIKRQTNNFLSSLNRLQKSGKGAKEFMIEREALAEKFSLEIFTTLNQMQPSSAKTLQLIDLIFHKLSCKPHILNAFKYASLQNLANIAWGIVDQNLQPLQTSSFQTIMVATVGKNDHISPYTEEQGLTAVCISLQYLTVLAGSSKAKVLANAIKIIDVHHDLVNDALLKICDALPSAEQKQIFIQRLKIVAKRFEEGDVKDKLLQFSTPNSLPQYNTTQATNNSAVTSPRSNLSVHTTNNHNNHAQDNDKDMLGYLPTNMF